MGKPTLKIILLMTWAAAASVHALHLSQESSAKIRANSIHPGTAAADAAEEFDTLLQVDGDQKSYDLRWMSEREVGSLRTTTPEGEDFQQDLSKRALQQRSSFDDTAEDPGTHTPDGDNAVDEVPGEDSNGGADPTDMSEDRTPQTETMLPDDTSMQEEDPSLQGNDVGDTGTCSTMRDGLHILEPGLFEFLNQVVPNGSHSQLAGALDDPNSSLTFLLPNTAESQALIDSVDLGDFAQRESAVRMISSHILMESLTLPEFLDFDSETTEDRMVQNLLGGTVRVHSLGSNTVMFTLNGEDSSLVFKRRFALGYPCAANSMLHRITRFMAPPLGPDSNKNGSLGVAVISIIVVASVACVALVAFAAWHFMLWRRRVTSTDVNEDNITTPVRPAVYIQRCSNSSHRSITVPMPQISEKEASIHGVDTSNSLTVKSGGQSGATLPTAFGSHSDPNIPKLWEGSNPAYPQATPPSSGRSCEPSRNSMSVSHALPMHAQRQPSSGVIPTFHLPFLGDQQRSGLSDMHALEDAVSTLGPTTCMTNAVVAPPGEAADAYEWKEYVAYQLDTLQEGEILEGYVLQEGLDARATGGQAVVQMAVHARSRKEVAIKFYVSRTAFQDEAAQYSDAASPLRSLLPRCLGIHDNADSSFVDGNGRPMPPCIVMEKGESLDRWVRRNHRDMDQFTCMQVVHHICECLMDLHAAGYAHRDVKPANVMWLPSQNRWTLIDFGCAAPLGTIANKAFTLAYAAPEAVRAAFREGERPVQVTTALDAWSLGVLAVELFTGRPALVAFHASKEQVISQILGEQPLPWEGAGQTASLLRQRAGRFRRAVLGLLRRNPAQRTLVPAFMQLYAGIMAASTQRDPPLLSASSSAMDLPPPSAEASEMLVGVKGASPDRAGSPTSVKSPDTDKTDSAAFHNARESPLSDE